MNWCCYLSADQDQQKHWYGDIAQCLEWGAGCIFKFKTKLIFCFQSLGEGRKIPGLEKRFSWFFSAHGCRCAFQRRNQQ